MKKIKREEKTELTILKEIIYKIVKAVRLSGKEQKIVKAIIAELE